MSKPVRRPAVAGQFYAADRDGLFQSIEECFLSGIGPGTKPEAKEPPTPIRGLVMPHAGYMYSGPVAAHGYYECASQRDIELAVIAGPNHWGLGSGVAVPKSGVWRTPLGDVEVDAEAVGRLVKEAGIVDLDDAAHEREHSIEVQLPFLQFVLKGGFKLLPICMALQDKSTAEELGLAMARIMRDRRALLIASSDFTHYEPHETASRKDGELIKAILELDVNKFYTVLRRLNVSACGYGPITSVMTAAKSLGATQGKLLKYATSGDVTGDYTSVVGYASVMFT